MPKFNNEDVCTYDDTKALNERLAKWAGFTKADTIARNGYHWEKGIRVPDWMCPDGTTSYRGASRLYKGDPPDFPNDLNACFKWIVPRLQYWKLEPALFSSEDTFACAQVNGHNACALGTPTSRALCLAVEKVIDA